MPLPNTPNLDLKQWEDTDDFDAPDVNAQFLKIDTETGVTTCTSATRPTVELKRGRMIYETDTGNIMMWDGDSWEKPVLNKDTGWLDISEPSGWTIPTGPGWQYRKINGVVHFQGVWQNNAFTGGHTTLFTLGSAYRPATDVALPLNGNTFAMRSCYVNNLGEVRVYAEAASGSWWTIGGSFVTTT